MKVSVIGLGKLGAPLAAVLASRGHDVVGVDVNTRGVALLNDGKAPVDETGLQELLDESGSRLRATTDMADAVASSDVSFVIVPTPSDEDGRFSLRFILPAVDQIGVALRHKSSRHLVVITSTVMPGATDGPIRSALEQASGLVVGESVGLCYSPEFIALGSVIHDMLNPDLLLVGESDTASGDLLAEILLRSVNGEPPVMKMNLVNAELAKISVNTYVTTKISYANMLAEICEQLPDADASVVTRAIGMDSRIGPKYLRGATAYGGPCFPRDNIAFSKLARGLGVVANLAEATDEINRRQVDRLVDAVTGHLGADKRVTVLGLSYKPSTAVVDESVGIAAARRLAEQGVATTVYDPVANDNARLVLGETVTFAPSLASALAEAEVTLVTTAWPEFKDVARQLHERSSHVAAVVVDCWHVVEATTGVDLVHVGVGPSSGTVE